MNNQSTWQGRATHEPYAHSKGSLGPGVVNVLIIKKINKNMVVVLVMVVVVVVVVENWAKEILDLGSINPSNYKYKKCSEIPFEICLLANQIGVGGRGN